MGSLYLTMAFEPSLLKHWNQISDIIGIVCEFYPGFKDCPEGILTKEKVIQIFSTLGMTQIDDLVNNIFSVFDRDGDGVMNFREFLLATHESATGSAQQKLKWQFRLYDRDGSGCIDLKEMIEILVMILQN